MTQRDECEGECFKGASCGDIALPITIGEADRNKLDEALKENKRLLKRVKDALGDRVTEVRISTRLTDSPSVLVLGEHDLGTSMRRILAAAGQNVPESKPFLELNVEHPLVRLMEGESDEERFKELAQLLYDQAALAEGGQLSNPAAYVQRLNRVLIRLAGASATKEGANA